MMGSESKIIMISAVDQQTVINKGKELGASDYIVKPLTLDSLVEVVNEVFSESQTSISTNQANDESFV